MSKPRDIEWVDCPHCRPDVDECEYQPLLECSSRNWQGHGVDVGHCPECGRAYSVSYVVDKVTPMPKLNWPNRAEREQEIAKVKEAEKAKRQKRYDKLKKEFEPCES